MECRPVQRIIAGVDEAGRGPLAGPVVAAAVVLDPKRRINGLTDSKLLSEQRRNVLNNRIIDRALAWHVAHASVAEIDQYNILQASLLAMQRAVSALKLIVDEAWVDGPHCPVLDCQTRAFIKGDTRITCISAASIIAKVARDRLMQQLDQQYPGYGFAQHKGYGTKAHLQALAKLGPTSIHRQSFAPVKGFCVV